MVVSVALLISTGCDYFPSSLLVPDSGPLDALVDGPTRDGPAYDGPTRDGPAYDGPAPDGPAPDGPAPDGLTPGDLLVPDKLPVPDTIGGPLVKIVAGQFKMGSLASELCRESDEDLHQVTLTHDFWIFPHEVTQAQFMTAMGYNPSFHSSCGSNCPVENVTWHEAAAYCNALSTAQKLGQCYTCQGSGASVKCTTASVFSGGGIYSCPGYRLPTEAEWEYAARAGTTTSLYSGAITSCTKADAKVGSIAWYSGNTSSTMPVGQKQKNAWGLFDLHGNVWEWNHDWYQSTLGTSNVTDPWGGPTGTHRCCRGGAFYDKPRYLRSASRGVCLPGSRDYWKGLRCVRTVKP